MKKLIVSAVMILALAGGSVFAAQNKNAGSMKPAAGTTMKKKHKKHHKKSTGTMTKNKNS